jgi:hypothetical protein
MKIISVDNLDREGWQGDEVLIAENVPSDRYARIMCEALIQKLCLQDDDRFYRVVPDDHKLKKFEP